MLQMQLSVIPAEVGNDLLDRNQAKILIFLDYSSRWSDKDVIQIQFFNILKLVCKSYRIRYL